MKLLKHIFSLVFFVCVLTGCSSLEKTTVYGTPGTKIYSPDKQLLGTVSQSGKADLNLKGEAYFGYLYTFDNKNDLWTPFALDVKKNTHGGSKIAGAVGTTLMGAGAISLLSGALVGCMDTEGTDGVMLGFMGAGLGLGGVGFAIGYPAVKRMNSITYQYNFGYAASQRTNEDLTLTGYIPPKAEEMPASKPRRSASGDGNLGSNAASLETNSSGSSSTARRRMKASSEIVSGRYSGTGFLESHSGVRESLGKIAIVITPKSDDIVLAEIFEDNEPFFDSKEFFNVTPNSDGSFTLTHTKVPSVKFLISKSGDVDYRHPSVNIDDSIHTLSIAGKRD